jgi:hypothetical protein
VFASLDVNEIAPAVLHGKASALAVGINDVMHNLHRAAELVRVHMCACVRA